MLQNITITINTIASSFEEIRLESKLCSGRSECMWSEGCHSPMVLVIGHLRGYIRK